MFDHLFVARIRLLTSENTVYFPIFFSQYELSPSGFWRWFSFGMISFYKEDFERTGGFDMTKSGWGEEDVELAAAFITEKVKINRANDGGLFHPFHNKSCTNTNDKQKNDCIQTKYSHKADIFSLYQYYQNKIMKTYLMW